VPAPQHHVVAELLFDGGSRGNPGPSYGSYRLKLPGAAAASLHRRTFGRMTNNEAEYATLIAGLEDMAQALKQAGIPAHRIRLEVRGDSQLVLAQLAGEWRVRNPRLQAHWARARDLLDEYGSVVFQRVPRWRVVKVLGH
jgi:ribonuclease HI